MRHLECSETSCMRGRGWLSDRFFHQKSRRPGMTFDKCWKKKDIFKKTFQRCQVITFLWILTVNSCFQLFFVVIYRKHQKWNSKIHSHWSCIRLFTFILWFLFFRDFQKQVVFISEVNSVMFYLPVFKRFR